MEPTIEINVADKYVNLHAPSGVSMQLSFEALGIINGQVARAVHAAEVDANPPKRTA